LAFTATITGVILTLGIADGILFPKVREWWNTDNPEAIAALEPHAKTPDVATVKKQMTPAQLALGDPFVNSVGMLLVPIPAGTFMMGSPETEKGREPLSKYSPVTIGSEQLHKVTITKPFYMQAMEVTQGQWKAVMGTEPWKGEKYVKEGANYAATYVSWDDAVAYCKKLSEKEGKTYRLPTEAEWEYACRAGTKTMWSFGDDEKEYGDYAWYQKNASTIGEGYAHQVGLKKSNPFGLYDMHGNVVEWCHDYYGNDYYQQSPEKDPQGATADPYVSFLDDNGKFSSDNEGLLKGFFHVERGGAWFHGNRHAARSADRSKRDADELGYDLGFRLVRELD
jgi:formylglycine-generating enzyme required for sulfatase activity